MKSIIGSIKHTVVALLALPLCLAGGTAWATVAGINAGPGGTFNLTATTGLVSTGDGNSLLMWGYANGAGTAQYPGPTLIVNQGDVVTVNLTNNLPVTTSIVFPGQAGVTTSGGTAGLLTAEAAPGAVVSYSFTATNAGTYMYQSGTRPDVQAMMGMVGTLIVRPATAGQAYESADTSFVHEYLFLLSEMDKTLNEQVDFLTAQGNMNDATQASLDTTNFNPTLWFINGRNGTDTLFPDFIGWMPHQPYGSIVRTHPAERVLLRVIGAGRDLHPFHTHGNNISVIAQDGRLLSSASGVGADLARSEYTLKVVPGATYDAIFDWNGKGLGWDIYGHALGDAMRPDEVAEDHGKPFPIVLPEQQNLVFGGFWSGNPFLGVFGNLPPGEGGLNPDAGFTYMWHSHTERELTNDDIFPGGMMTMLIVEAPGVPIE
jgi:FtsP/CotA-like multicopper oxidase with cupredoxin domain